MSEPLRITESDSEAEIDFIQQTDSPVMRIMREQVPDEWDPEEIQISADPNDRSATERLYFAL